MKKLLIIFFSLCIAIGVSAQRGHSGVGHYSGGHYGGRTRVVISAGGYAPYWGFGYGYPWGYPPVYSTEPSGLDLQIEGIKADYKDRIWSARHDKSLSKSQRKEEIHSLKTERDAAILHEKENYYKQDVSE